MAKTKKFRTPASHGDSSHDAVELLVILRSLAWSTAAVAGWLTGLRDEVEQYGGSEAVGDLLAASQVLSAAADQWESAGFEMKVSMPDGIRHQTPHEFLEEKRNEKPPQTDVDDFPF